MDKSGKIRKAQQTAKKIRKAQAELYDEEEKQQIITSKRQEFIKKQEAAHDLALNIMRFRAEIEEVTDQIDKHEQNGEPIKMLWYGMPYPVKILKLEYARMINNWKRAMSELAYKKEEFSKAYQMTDEEIEKALTEGIYKKELPDEKST